MVTVLEASGAGVGVLSGVSMGSLPFSVRGRPLRRASPSLSDSAPDILFFCVPWGVCLSGETRNVTRMTQQFATRSGNGWIRPMPGEFLSGGGAAYLHAADREDTSPAHAGYDPDCGWCWLGAPHTRAAHQVRVAGVGTHKGPRRGPLTVPARRDAARTPGA